MIKPGALLKRVKAQKHQAASWRLAGSVRPIGGLGGPWSVPGAAWAMPPKRQRQKRPTSAEAEDSAVEDGAVADGLGSPGRAEVAGALQGAKRKKEEGGAGSGGAGGLAEAVQQSRLSTAPSVAEFKYNKKRVRLISENPDLKEGARGIVYWMSRDQRVQDNWAFLYAQRLALKQRLPLHVCFCLVPKFLEATIRHFGFMLRGLEEVAEECQELRIPFHLLTGFAKDTLPRFVTQHGIGGVVTDFAPLRVPLQWVQDVRDRLPPDVPFVQVDAHNIVPCWVASDKQEYGARTIRRKIHDQLAEFLTEFPPVVRHPFPAGFQAEVTSGLGAGKGGSLFFGNLWPTAAVFWGAPLLCGWAILRLKSWHGLRQAQSLRIILLDPRKNLPGPASCFEGTGGKKRSTWETTSPGSPHRPGSDDSCRRQPRDCGGGSAALSPVDWGACRAGLEVDRSVKEVAWATPGTAAGLLVLEQFIRERLRLFGTDRNNPNRAALSNLSPWFHFGQVSVQRAVLEVRKHRARFKDSVDSFIEEAVVRRELADNFCFYNQNYDQVKGAYDWAKTTLKLHSKDKRPHLYTLQQLEEGKTHDPLWNAAQLQMVHEGKMHGFLRMYWAKKILEWTRSPEEALQFSIFLNDRYELDGRDPNGYVGCMWSICGIHDQGWAERPVFGKIRYMNYAGCQRKFDVGQFERKYGPHRFAR